MATSTYYATNSGRWHNGHGNVIQPQGGSQTTTYSYGWRSGNSLNTGRYYGYYDYGEDIFVFGNYGNQYGLVWFDMDAVRSAMADQTITAVTLTLRRNDSGGYNPSGDVMGGSNNLYVYGLTLAASGKGSTAIGNTYGVHKDYVTAGYATYGSAISRNSTIAVSFNAATFRTMLDTDEVDGLILIDGDDTNVTQGDADHVYGDGINGRSSDGQHWYGPTNAYMTFAGYDDGTYKPYITITHEPNEPSPTSPTPVTPGTITADAYVFDWSDATDNIFATGQLYYEMQLSVDNGANYGSTFTSSQGSSTYTLSLKTYLSLQTLQYYYNAIFKFRVRTKTPDYGGSPYYSSWVESGTFTVDYRLTPTAPASLTPSDSDVYEGEAITFTVGRPVTYNTHNSAGSTMNLTYYVRLSTGTALANSTEPCTSATESVPYNVGELCSGTSDLSTYVNAYVVDAESQTGAACSNVAFTVRRFRVPSITGNLSDRTTSQVTVNITVTDTGYGGTQSDSQITNVEYRLDGGSWTEASFGSWSGLTNSFDITGLDENEDYTLDLRVTNDAPGGTALSDLTSSTYSVTGGIQEYTPAILIWEDSGATGNEADQGVSVKALVVGDDFEAAVEKGWIAAQNGVSIGEESVLLKVYPIGSIYISVSSTNPGTLFGGTWAAFGAGKVLVGLDSEDADFDTAEETGGAKTHTLTTDEMPSHNHRLKSWAWGYTRTGGADYLADRDLTYDNYDESENHIGNRGGGGAHNNLQPYIVVYMWERTA
jgi:hypothetical protein